MFSVDELSKAQRTILELAKRLLDAELPEDIDGLDFIDGAFYWEICRAADKARLYKQIELLAEAFPDKDFEEINGRPRHRHPLSDDERKKALERLESFRDFARFESEMISVIPNYSEWISGIRPVRLRDRTFRIFSGAPIVHSDRYPSWAQLGVTSSGWTGERVEHELRQAIAEDAQRAADNSGPHYSYSLPETNSQLLGVVGVVISAVLPGDPIPRELRAWTDFDDTAAAEVKMRTPIVMVNARIPVPTEGVIAAIYDATNASSHLLGDRNGQTNLVAVRTWAIGLLRRSGLKLPYASRYVSEYLRIALTAERIFQKDLNALLRRVPEAEKHLSVRRV